MPVSTGLCPNQGQNPDTQYKIKVFAITKLSEERQPLYQLMCSCQLTENLFSICMVSGNGNTVIISKLFK